MTGSLPRLCALGICLALSTVAVPVAAIHGGADCGSLTGMPQCMVHDVLWCVDQASDVITDTLEDAPGEVGRTVSEQYRDIKCKLHTRPPLVIDGQPSVDQQVLYNIEGSGSPGDPYVIQNFEVAGSQKATVYHPEGQESQEVVAWNEEYDVGIEIRDSNAHYVVKKVYVHGFDTGIKIKNADDVKIVGSVVNGDNGGQSDAIQVRADDTVIRGNVLEANRHSVLVPQPYSDVDIRNNRFQRDGSIRVRADRVEIRDNTFRSHDGPAVKAWAEKGREDEIWVTGNDIESYAGVSITSYTGSTRVANNRIDTSIYAVSMLGSLSNPATVEVRNNDIDAGVSSFSRIYRPVVSEYSVDSTIHDNDIDCKDWGAGIYLYLPDAYDLSGNSFNNRCDPQVKIVEN